jgi:hypothetical protein
MDSSMVSWHVLPTPASIWEQSPSSTFYRAPRVGGGWKQIVALHTQEFEGRRRVPHSS